MNTESKVYWTRELSGAGVARVFAPLRERMQGKIAVKTHFGERGNVNYLSPDYSRSLVAALNASYIETRVLYVGPRHTGEGHTTVAHEHGFDFAPIDIIDDPDEIVVPYDGRHFQAIRLGAGIDRYDGIVVLSHFKGHVLAGFGGAIKNIGMGMASVSGKMAMHASKTPQILADRCVECGRCIEHCPADAITIKPVVIDPKICIGCGSCIGNCPQDVFQVPWDSTSPDVFQERLVEYADAARKRVPMVYINILANISAYCDCLDVAPAPFIKDIGIVASDDLLAVDQAAFDLVNQAYGSTDAFLQESHVSGRGQLLFGAEIGLGSPHYELIDLD